MTRKSPTSPSKNETRARTKAGRGRPRGHGATAQSSAAGKKTAAAPEAGSIPDAPPAAEGPTRVIRRYGNRRLYDARLSRCVTMEEIAGFVRAGDDVRVVDVDTNADITKRVLVQLILEEQNGSQLELLPIGFLRALLGVRGESISGWLEQYLAAGTEWLERAARQAAPLTAGWSGWPIPNAAGFPGMNVNPFAAVTGLGNMMGGAANAAASPTGAAPPPRDAPPREPAPAAAGDDADLKRRLDELTKQLADLGARVKRR